jgi:hypothetical protein
VLADSLGAERIAELWPDADPEQPYAFARDRLSARADEVVDERSIRLHGEHHHPRDRPSESQRVAGFREQYAAAWAIRPGDVIDEVRARVHALGGALELDDEPGIYLAGALDDLVDELVNATFEHEATIESRASLRFDVRAPQWIAHLSVGDTWDSVAHPA